MNKSSIDTNVHFIREKVEDKTIFTGATAANFKQKNFHLQELNNFARILWVIPILRFLLRDPGKSQCGITKLKKIRTANPKLESYMLIKKNNLPITAKTFFLQMMIFKENNFKIIFDVSIM